MCTPEVPKTRLWRNGMDYEPKKTYPPDYSKVPDVRSWQMSPFSQERFDLNEIQIAQKKGIKGKAELERLLKLYGKKEGCKEEVQCPKCAERQKAEKRQKCYSSGSCGVNYLYQPYGPSMLSTASYRDSGANRTKIFCVSAPMYSDFHINKSNPQMVSSPLSCKGFGSKNPVQKFSNGYIPYGPSGSRFTTCAYEPMGPINFPKLR